MFGAWAAVAGAKLEMNTMTTKDSHSDPVAQRLSLISRGMSITLEYTFELFSLLRSRADAHTAGAVVRCCRALTVKGGSVQRILLCIAIEGVVRRVIVHWSRT